MRVATARAVSRGFLRRAGICTRRRNRGSNAETAGRGEKSGLVLQRGGAATKKDSPQRPQSSQRKADAGLSVVSVRSVVESFLGSTRGSWRLVLQGQLDLQSRRGQAVAVEPAA